MRDNIQLDIENYSEELVNLNADQEEITIKNIDKMLMGLSLLKENIKNKELESGLIKAVMGSCEYNFTDISKQLGHDNNIKKDIEKRHEKIRNANTKIRELEEELANKTFNSVTITECKDYLDVLKNKIEKWWKMEGFQYVEEFLLTPYTISVKFGFHEKHSFFEENSSPAESREKKKSWLENVKKNWDIGTGNNFEVLNTDRNNKKFQEMFGSLGGKIWISELHANKIRKIEVVFKNDELIRNLE